MHQFGWLSERGGNFLNLLQKEGGTQKGGGVPSEKGGSQPWRKLWFWGFLKFKVTVSKSSHPEVFLRKGILKICSKFTGEHPCQSGISIKLLCNFIEIAIQHSCSPVHLLHIFRTHFPNNISGWLLLSIHYL